MSNTTYTAITIGPILKTFFEAKRTRAVWAASYFYSWISRRILEDSVNQEMQVFLPDISLMKVENNKKIGIKSKFGAGLYADRLYFVNDNNTNKELLSKILDNLFEEIAKKSQGVITKDFVSSYLNIHILEKIISDENLKNGDYPLAILNRALDNKELHQNYNFDYEKNPLLSILNSKTSSINNFLANDAFGESNDRFFKSIPEISTASFNRNKDFSKAYQKEVLRDLRSKEETDLIDQLIESAIPLQPHHKYFAVIYADGDGIGDLLKEINQKNLDIKDFSKSLFEFGLNAEKTIEEYGGNGIYLGGEDILAFVPVTCIDENDSNTQNTIFNLIQNLDVDFKNTVQIFAEQNQLNIPTLSYGVMIAYHKHPLKEVMKQAHFQLDEIAKKKGKNGIAIHFQKHSGQSFDCFIQKKYTKSLSEIYKIIEIYCKTPKTQLDSTDELLSSIIQKFRDTTFIQLYLTAIELGNLDAFFANFFNEKIHSETTKSQFINQVKVLSEILIKEYPDKDDVIKNLYTILRFIHFINSQKDN